MNIVQLIRGTYKVLPVAIERIGDGKNTPIKQLDIVNFRGLNSVVVRTLQEKSGRFPTSKRPSGRSGFYKQNVRFTSKEFSKLTARKPRLAEDKATVRCGCDAYYYYFWAWNKRHKAHEGSNFAPYVRKTIHLPKKNPSEIPGLCKHLLHVITELRKRGKVTT